MISRLLLSISSACIACTLLGCQKSDREQQLEAERAQLEVEAAQLAARERAARTAREANRLAAEEIAEARTQAAQATTAAEYHAAAARIKQAQLDAIRQTNFALSESVARQAAAEQRAQSKTVQARFEFDENRNSR